MPIYQGQPASTGLTIGQVIRLKRGDAFLHRMVQEPSREQASFEAAVAQAKRELEKLIARTRGPEKDIFLFQQMLLEDEGLLAEIVGYIDAGAGSAAAVERAGSLYAQSFSELDDAYLRERNVDVRDACRRVVDILDGRPRERLALDEPCILAADEFFPSDIVGLGRGMILGLASARGSANSHAAILARSIGVPMVVQLGSAFLADCHEKVAVLNGEEASLLLEPSWEEERNARRRMEAYSLQQQQNRIHASEPCTTRDGTQIKISANAMSLDTIEEAIQAGVRSIGLLRSEFVVDPNAKLSEEDQYEQYWRCLNTARGRHVVIRTFDFGSDSTPPGLPLSGRNPALGLRGFRCAVARHSLQIDQLCALLRLSVGGNLDIAFPTVTCLEDWQECLRLLDTAKNRLRSRGVPFDGGLRPGIVIDTPAAALNAEELSLSGVAFFLISAGDIAQYAYAADRMNVQVQRFYRPRGRALMRLMRMAMESGRRHGLPVSICGIGLDDPLLAEQYVRSGARELVLSPRLIPEVYRHLRTIDLRE